MHTAVLQAIQNNDNAAMMDTYDEVLARQFDAFTPQQQAHLHSVAKRIQWEKALQNNDYGNVISLAQEISRELHEPFDDFRLLQAQQRFIRQFHPLDVVAWRKDDDVWVQWSWPVDELVRHAVIVWRHDRWPQNPARAEVGTSQELIFRQDQAARCLACFKATRLMGVYLQVFFALPDYRTQPPTMLYSDGHRSDAKAMAFNVHLESNVI
jgi:hypothetical protein